MFVNSYMIKDLYPQNIKNFYNSIIRWMSQLKMGHNIWFKDVHMADKHLKDAQH